MQEAIQEQQRSGDRAAAISRQVVGTLKELGGRGPTRAKTHILEDCVVVLLRDGHTPSEQTLYRAGEARSVAQGRVDFSETIRAPLIEIVEQNTGQKVAGFMSSSQHDPELLSFVFVFAISPVLGVEH